MWLALLAPAYALVCADDPVAELEQTMTGVLDANQQVDELAFDRYSKLMDAALICINGPLPPSTMARLHHTMALRSFIAGQTRAAKRSLAALRLADPRWKSPFPEGHPFTSLWLQATDPGPVESIGKISPKVWIIDGVERNEAPTERAFLLQVREGDDTKLTRYLFDLADLPDFGQNDTVDLNSTPWNLSVRGLAFGRLLGQQQRPEASSSLGELGASGGGAGGALVARFTPNAVIGGELAASVATGDDAIVGGGTGVDARAVILLGAGFAAVGDGALFAAARLGLVTDTARYWPRAAAGVQPLGDRLWGGSAGVETGWRGAQGHIDLTVDGALAGFTSPWRLDGSLGGTRLVSESVGVRAQVDARTQGQQLLDGDVVAGRASERELRVAAGLDLVF
jgi:hypothetical protein